MTIAVHWQDADSTAERGTEHFGDVTKLCGGHLYTCSLQSVEKN